MVSVHDVAPATRTISEKIIAELARHGVRVSSLLVVPNYHHRGVSMGDRDFVRWLRELEAEGHEIVIHGYFHQRPASDRETLGDKVITRFYTRTKANFSISATTKRSTESRARGRVSAAGLQPRGFIAPAWLLGTEGERAASDAEMEYTTRLRTVLDLRTAQSFAARSLVYSVRNEWRRSVSRLWNGALRASNARVRLVRLSIHPPDYSFPGCLGSDRTIPWRDGGNPNANHLPDWIAEKRLQNRN